MIKKASNIFNSYITLGADKNTNQNELKKIKLLHIFCNTWHLFTIFSFVEDYIKDQLILISYPIMLALVISVQLLQYYKKFNIARIVFIVSLTITAFIFSNYIYKAELLEYYFLLPFAISLIYIDSKKVNVIVFVICLLGLFLPNLYFKHYPFSVFNNQNVPFLFLSLFIIINYFKDLNLKNEKALEERKQELENINNFQSQFFINISHEIRTPLTLIKGEIEQLEDYEQDLPNIKNIKQGLHNEVNKISAMVNDVLDLSKIEASNFALNLKTISITELLQKLYLSFETIFKQKNINFNLKPYTHNYFIIADSIHIERAINNIIINASKYTDTNDNVTLNIYPEDNNIIISIADTGIGISQADIDKVCNQFYQVKNHINNSGGSGIGLSFTKEIINLHHGTLHIESEVGFGSTFKIILPLKATKPLNSIISIENTSENTLINTLKPIKKREDLFLVVDDNLKMRHYIIRILNKYSYNSLQAENGIEALDILKNNTIHCIITDYMMPKMDGFNFVKSLKEQKIDIPVLMLTARHDNQSRLNIFRLGIDDYLTKPFENEELIIRIENTLKNYKKRNLYINQENISTTEIEDTNSWIDSVEKFISEHCSSIEFKQNDIAEYFNMSNSTLYRKIKVSKGLTPAKLITEIKLQKAREIIENNNTAISLKQLALEVGFQHTSHFSTIYYNRFGSRPIKKE